MNLITIITSLFLLGDVYAKGGGRGGGGGSSSGGGGGGSSSSYFYSADDCYGLDVNPIVDIDSSCVRTYRGRCKEGFQIHNQWIYDDITAGSYPSTYRGGRDNSTRNTLSNSTANTNWVFDIYDAYYNGTFSVKLEPDSNNQTISSCATFQSQKLNDGYLRIGSSTHGNASRSKYDTNPYYFSFGRTFKGDCPATPNKLFQHFESSNDNLEQPDAWNLTVAKKDNKFELAGSIGSGKASFNNYFNYLVNTTDAGFPAKNGTVKSNCPSYIKKRTMTSANQVSMKATIDATSATMSWSFIDPTTGYKVTGSFEGKIWKDGAHLDMSSNNIATTGQSKRIVPPKPKNFLADNLKYFILAAVIVFILLVVWIAFCCCRSIFTCCSRRRKQKQEPSYAKAAQTEGYSYRP
ncbi:hypothetical protein EJ08DRAFT_702791 [Tothia fuscella]|uniref:Uncharacterized protein n=1 Tax=Tothia fuscella TaxID=1048955 RepID=A0A9P4NFQ4_9PEZI|nr:hypothetical protein EJ08DRAFT_702791 [Tothia fuscella]